MSGFYILVTVAVFLIVISAYVVVKESWDIIKQEIKNRKK